MRRTALFSIYANLFKVWFNRRQLNSRICFSIQSIAICCFGWSIWRESTFAQSWKRKDPVNPWKGLRELQRFLDRTLITTRLRGPEWVATEGFHGQSFIGNWPGNLNLLEVTNGSTMLTSPLTCGSFQWSICNFRENILPITLKTIRWICNFHENTSPITFKTNKVDKQGSLASLRKRQEWRFCCRCSGRGETGCHGKRGVVPHYRWG